MVKTIKYIEAAENGVFTSLYFGQISSFVILRCCNRVGTGLQRLSFSSPVSKVCSQFYFFSRIVLLAIHCP